VNKDFRVAVSLPTHPKSIKLMRRCGDRAFYCLIRFWAYVAQNRPAGDLSGLDADDIEIAAGWTGQCSELYQALLELRFIEKTESGLMVHDWDDHNGYASHAEDRAEKARKAAEKRWNARNKDKTQECSEHTQALLNDATSNAPSPTPTPTPSPNPDPTPNPVPSTKKVSSYSQSFELFWSEYPRKVGKDAAYKAWQQIGKKNKATVTEIMEAIKKQDASAHFVFDGKVCVPNPATWLNQGRWNDEITTRADDDGFDREAYVRQLHEKAGEVA
jgi:hypothetical protein